MFVSAYEMAHRLNLMLKTDPKKVNQIFLEQSEAISACGRINHMLNYYGERWSLLVVFDDYQLTKIRRFDIMDWETETQIVTDPTANDWFDWGRLRC